VTGGYEIILANFVGNRRVCLKSDKPYLAIVEHYESCLDQHGDNHLGVDWPNADDVRTRYKVMLEVARNESGGFSLLDFGCGAGHFYEFLIENGRQDVAYRGVDLSQKFISLCRSKHPNVDFQCLDVFDTKLSPVDYVVINGVLTEKQANSFEVMWDYCRNLLEVAFSISRKGLAFNVMSSHVDWERDDLFHLPLDTLSAFLTTKLTRNYIIRNDYGLYEYTTYLYKERCR
jgi:SAM-dependent methyltransferase